MKNTLLILSILVLFIACNEPTDEPVINTDNKFVSISPLNLTGEITSMNFFNTIEGTLTSSSGGYWQTTDGGQIWNDTGLFNQTWLGNLHFFDREFGFCSGNDTNTFIYDTAKWSHYNFPVKNCAVSSFFKLTEKIIYATTMRGENEQGFLVQSNDNGLTWDTVYSALADFTQVLFLNDQTGFVITKSENKIGLMKTTDGGTSWYGRIPSVYGTYFNNTARLEKLVSIDDEHLMIIGRGNKNTEGLLLTSSDGGENWEIEILTYALNDVEVTNDFVYLVGDELFAVQWPINLSAFSNPTLIINSWNKYEQESDFLINDQGYLVLQYHDITKIQFINDNTAFIATNNKSMVFKINVVATE